MFFTSFIVTHTNIFIFEIHFRSSNEGRKKQIILLPPRKDLGAQFQWYTLVSNISRCKKLDQ